MGKKLETSLAVLNGAIGDYLARTKNGLATPMEVVHQDRPVRVARGDLARAFPDATGRVVVFVHGLMCNETVWRFEDGEDYGSLLAREPPQAGARAVPWTPLYVRYNSGLAIADSGAALAAVLEALAREYPVPIEELLLIGFSMGGLVIRAACHAASRAASTVSASDAAGHVSAAADAKGSQSTWLPLVRRAIYVGTPHLGAPYERLGRTVAKVLSAIPNPYTRLIADIANLRSAGLQDLGDADLRHEDRAHKATLRLRDWRHPVPLLPAIEHYLVAGTLSEEPWLAALFGDSVVPVPSATRDHAAAAADETALARDHVKIVPGVAHMGLAHSREVYAHIQAWCGGPS